jgi:hypothetical protein
VELGLVGLHMASFSDHGVASFRVAVQVVRLPQGR